MLDYTGFDEKVITVKCSDENIAGKTMTISGNDNATVSASGDAFLGFGVASRDGYATVQVGGYAKVKTSGEGISHGRISVVADGEGGIREAQNGVPVQVISYDYDTKIAGIIF